MAKGQKEKVKEKPAVKYRKLHSRFLQSVSEQRLDAAAVDPKEEVEGQGAADDLRNGVGQPNQARHEVLCTLEDVVREGSRVLKSGGKMYMVHRPHRLIEIITVMKQYKLEPKRMKMVHPFYDKEANMVLIEAVKGGGSWLKMEAPIIVYKEPGVYTDEIWDIYGY